MVTSWGFFSIKLIARPKWPDISTSEVDILTPSKDILFSSTLTTWPVMLTALPLITSNHLLNRHHNFMSWHFDPSKPNILILYSTLTNHYYFFFITLSIYFTTLKKAVFFFGFFFYWKVKCNIQWVADFLLSIWVFLVRLWSFFYHSADEKEFVQRRWLYRSPKHNELSH